MKVSSVGAALATVEVLDMLWFIYLHLYIYIYI